MNTKKQLRRNYDEMKPRMGVFQIRNTVNDKIYIEGHVDMVSRWNRHKTELRFGSHRNKILQGDWNEYGASQFVFEVLSELQYEDDKTDYSKDLIELTKMVAEELESFQITGYNSIK